MPSKEWLSSIIISVVIPFFISCSSRTHKVTPVCEDFLKVWQEKPSDLQFIRCKKVKKFGFDRLESFYVVKGSDAARVEKILQRKFGMASLKFLCCGWEPIFKKGDVNTLGLGNYRDKNGIDFEISMYSEETIITDRQEWDKIPEFRIYVSMFLENP
ncbi:MAG: DUF4952 domain-containing protein [Cyanobacteria bacterium SBLK]|nr:DUF4952 domain-containing protein [Cyanobacteria bacterium SBLK]